MHFMIAGSIISLVKVRLKRSLFARAFTVRDQRVEFWTFPLVGMAPLAHAARTTQRRRLLRAVF